MDKQIFMYLEVWKAVASDGATETGTIEGTRDDAVEA